MPIAYKVLKDSKLEPRATAGTTVYDFMGYDYGLASDDTRITGVHHVSVTLDTGGAAPSFTIPRADLEPLQRKPACNCEQDHYLPAWRCPVHGDVVVPMD